VEKEKVTKGLVVLGAAAGAGMLVQNGLNSLKPKNANKLETALMFLGGLALVSMATEAVYDYSKKAYDATATACKEVLKKFQIVKKEEPT